MSMLLADNFQYQGRKPLDSRLICDTISDMAALAESIIYEGILVYNKETKKFYSFDPANTADPILNKWREFKTDGGGSGNALIEEYKQSTDYQKDTLIYCGDRIGRAAIDFTSDATRLPIEESFLKDIERGYIVVDKIDIKELDEQLLKALPIVAFVTKKDIPRFESNMIIDGSIPTFRDGSALSDVEKKGCNFLYIIDNNGELTGLAIVTNYDDIADEFTVNAMKYGVGTADNIIPTKGILTKREVGEIQIVQKDEALNPLFIIKSSPPIDNTKLWYEYNELDSSDISVGAVTVKKYNNVTKDWDINEIVDVKDSDIVKNGNGAEWQYYRIQSDGNIFVSLAKWQLVYDTAQILGKIIDINTSTHELTIKTIHANPETDPLLTEDIQANIAIGAAPANFKYPEGMTFTEFVKKIAVKDIPVSVNLTATSSGLRKKGITINGTTLTATITNLGNIPIKTLQFYIGNTLLDEYTFIDGTTTYTYDYDDPIQTDTSFSVVVEQDKNYTVKKEVKFTFVNPTYVGVVNAPSPDESDILELQEVLKEGRAGTYTITMIDKRACYAYPSSMGNLTSIKDKNNFEYINSYAKTIEVVNGENYNVYTLIDPVTATNFTWIFN